MKFLIEEKERIMEKVGEMLTRAFESDNSFITLFMTPNVAALMNGQRPVCCIANNEDLNKQLDESFTDTIIRSGLKDKFAELMSFLVSVYDDLYDTYQKMMEGAYSWLISFLCDDKLLFRHCAIYLGFASLFGETVERFFRKFTYTRKHGKKMYSTTGDQIFHDLYEYCPITSPNFTMDLFKIEEYGELYKLVNKKYKEIINLIFEIHKFTLYIDKWAIKIHADGARCKYYLINLLKDYKKERMGSTSINGKFTIYPQEIDEAKDMLPEQLVKDISSIAFEDFCKNWYHELKLNLRIPFATLVWNKLLSQQKMTDMECNKVFNHIEDLYERNQKAIEARLLLEHFGELALLMVKEGQKKTKKPLGKGKMVCLFYKWTQTKMSENSFVTQYYNEECQDENYKVARTSLTSAKNGGKIDTNMEDLFNQKASQIIEKYKSAFPDLDTANSERQVPTTNTEIPFAIIAQQKTQAGNTLMASQH